MNCKIGRPRTRCPGVGLAALMGLLCVVLGGTDCERVKKALHEKAPLAERPDSIEVGSLQAGPKTRARPARNPYEDNSYAISEGQRLYNWYNCSGCHFRGGGGIGPALMDDVWIYGKDPGNIYATIVEGRPNGMPAWRGKIPEYQVWQIVTYVQSLEAEKSISSPPGPREEHLQAREGRPAR